MQSKANLRLINVISIVGFSRKIYDFLLAIVAVSELSLDEEKKKYAESGAKQTESTTIDVSVGGRTEGKAFRWAWHRFAWNLTACCIKILNTFHFIVARATLNFLSRFATVHIAQNSKIIFCVKCVKIEMCDAPPECAIEKMTQLSEVKRWARWIERGIDDFSLIHSQVKLLKSWPNGSNSCQTIAIVCCNSIECVSTIFQFSVMKMRATAVSFFFSEYFTISEIESTN